MDLPEKLLNVTKQFTRLPGVGEKTALRQTLTLSRWNKNELKAFASALSELAELENCQKCGMYSEGKFCSVCIDEHRGFAKSICVVESITDCLAIEKSGHFKGRFHILFGVLNPLMGIGPRELSLDSFFRRVQVESVEEIILAINPSVEGDATCAYIKQGLPKEIKIERIGFGIPMGGSLEFVDSLTISKALENRRHL